MNKITNADIIKAIFIDKVLNNEISLFENKEEILIGHEVMYGVQKLFADLVLVTPQKMIAIEIKAYSYCICFFVIKICPEKCHLF